MSSPIPVDDSIIDLTSDSQVPVTRPARSTCSSQLSTRSRTNSTEAASGRSLRPRRMERSSREAQIPVDTAALSSSAATTAGPSNQSSRSTLHTTAPSRQRARRVTHYVDSEDELDGPRAESSATQYRLVLPGQTAGPSRTTASAGTGSATVHASSDGIADVQITGVARSEVQVTGVRQTRPLFAAEPGTRITNGLAPGPNANPNAPSPVRADTARIAALAQNRLLGPFGVERRNDALLAGFAIDYGGRAPPVWPATGSGNGTRAARTGTAAKRYEGREKYIRKEYKSKYTHGKESSKPPFSDSILPPPISIGDDDDDGAPAGPGAAANDLTDKTPICAGCDKALQMENEDPLKFLYALPCGHVIDGECRDRLARKMADDKDSMTDPNMSDFQLPDGSHGFGGGSGSTKRPRGTASDTLDSAIVAPSPAKGTRSELGVVTPVGSSSHTPIPPPTEIINGIARNRCPVVGCHEKWVYNVGSELSCARLFL
ncbi:hypothetical protein K437DRAFT_257765 [Tilletiaria anomala UBC 951]|uniref:Uncharacterized protein n=1 Tax=Tilletiaria anomala (strain ATCC 24038 / CBS 436.72 / UBC 951) TaxID=1037660 RepID=A0A066VR41_TILAU|nr:uncharacterized protein K437DRAFT_257765 [Tilletiaria anomala UBC 951]KDN42738.1 hypothetical protein K437DRAFT_257765 [Tilletiaria anomala UBC 951]